MGDVIEKDFVAHGKLTIDLVWFNGRVHDGACNYSDPARPAASTILPQRTISSCRKRTSSSGVLLGAGFMPRSRMRPRTSAVATRVLSLALSFATISAGV